MVRSLIVLRYAATHDLHHVVTGFDTGLAGEAGVYAFTVAQGSSPGGHGMLLLVRLWYPLFSATQARRVGHHIRVGLGLGAAAKLVLEEPLESWFDQPLDDVRERLVIDDAIRAEVLPSGKRVLARWIYRPATS